MKFGLSLPTLTGFERSNSLGADESRERWRRSYEIVELAEELGFDFITVGHHRFDPNRVDCSQPLVALAALAARTTRLRLCTNILILPLHHPLDVAEQVAMVDEISDGRAMLGVAIGYRPYEFEQLGLDYKRRVDRFEEAIEIVRRAWRPEPVNFEGRHFSVKGANVSPKPVQRPGPPIYVGAQVDAAIFRAAALGDGWLTDNIEGAASLRLKIDKFRAESQASGNSGTVLLNRRIGIGDSKAKIEAEWLPDVIESYRSYNRLGVPFRAEFKAKLESGDQIKLDDLPPDQIIIGDIETCTTMVKHCADVTGCDYMIMDFGRGAHGDAYDRLYRQIDLFGKHVMPAFPG